MRTAPRWFLRRAHQLFPSNSSTAITLPKTLHNFAATLDLRPPFLSPFSPYSLSCARRSLHIQDAVPADSVAATDESIAAPENINIQKPAEPPSLSRWMRQVNKHLPANIRISLSEESLPQDNATHAPRPLTAKQLEKILVEARNEDGIDLLLWLVENDHRQTAVWLMETILSYPSLKKVNRPLKPPSNIDWPQDLFTSVRDSVIDLPSVSRPTFESVSNEDDFEPARSESREAQFEQRLLSRVWETLGSLIIKSAAAARGDTIDDNMLTALLVLGHIHNLDMMPDDVYAYNHLNRPTFVQRPPILNLVSSRILTALSDVAWRQQQDDAIIQAAHMGMSLKEISKTVPGGRFRLRVRPLGPEIWLELILWCCIESNQTAAALAIVKRLAAESEEPWFAIRWTSPQSREKLSTVIDWDRVKLRHGGSGGLIEGYSREKPFVDVPQKTISAEVILALIEKIIAVGLSSSLVNTSKLPASTIHKDFRPLRKTMADIEDVLTFLEPHDLPVGYFDYLETRLLHDDAFDTLRTPADLYTWSTRMKSIRNLEKFDAGKSLQPNLGLEEIHAHSLLHIAFQQQAMTAFVQFGDVHHTLAVFNEIQESIDKAKVASITDFLQQQPVSMEGPLTSHPSHELEFTNCHGQLPYHNLAGLLNLISDTKLIGLGRWLLYADDVDGATLPKGARNQACVTAALYKFAAVSQDTALLKATVHRKLYRGWLPTVNMLRARCNANMALLQWDSVREDLNQMRHAMQGGFGLSNVVHIVATILRLEQSKSEARDQSLTTAQNILDAILLGVYASNRSDFTVAARNLFRQQICCVLRVCTAFDGSLVSKSAEALGSNFRSTNLPVLPAKFFNVLLSAAVDTRGAAFGEKLWNKFCKTPDTLSAVEAIGDGTESLFHDDGSDPFVTLGSPVESDLSISKYEDSKSLEADSTQQYSQSVPTEELMEFRDPFFPKGMPMIKDVPVPVASEGLHKPPETAFGQDFKDVPLTIPNLQTLRLIVRAVATEMKDREESGLGIKTQKKQIAWAVEMFKAFGVIDKTTVEQEVEYPVDELDADIVKESKEMIEAARQRDKYELVVKQDLAVGSPVSSMWTPLFTDMDTYLELEST